MNFFVDRILGLAVGAVLIAGAAAPASAQQAQFHLPFEAKWAGIVLPPGDYSVGVVGAPLGNRTFVVRGSAGTSLILPMTADHYGARIEPPAKDYLQLVKVDGDYFVSKYEQGSRAVTFFFKTPKSSRRVQISDRDSTRIPVSGE
jgi:hypothetical protein